MLPTASSPNLSRHEIKALNQLVNDKSFIISKADKGDTVALLVSTAYVELAYEHQVITKHTNYYNMILQKK